MTNQFPQILALDFDGVICDGLIEYFASTKKAYQQIWSAEVDDRLTESFYRLRPVIETGWEMPILLRALVLGKSEPEIIESFAAIALEIIQAEGLEKSQVVHQLDGVRDHWIKSDLEGWLQLHRFYPGVIERLQQILKMELEFYIVTTKEGRFVYQLLQQQGINLPRERIIGKECQRPKYETLRILRQQHPEPEPKICFVEDRLKALEQVAAQEDLATVDLFLADWGYNLERDRTYVRENSRIKLLSLELWQQDLASW